MNRITNLTRRDIIEVLIVGIDIDMFIETNHYYFNFWGRMTTVEFLNRLYSLKDLPSLDSRYKNAEEDIRAHTMLNPDDYPNNWLFVDERFPLMNGSDEDFLLFMCEIFHPEVRNEKVDWKTFLNKINDLLRKDDYELYPKGQISGRDVYGWKDLTAKRFYRLKENEITCFLQLFNRGGYVLNFSTPEFDSFTKKIVNIGLCSRYGLSKGKSLECFVDDGTEAEVIKLFNALMDHYEMQPEYIKEINGNDKWNSLYKKCKEILSRVASEPTILIEHAEHLKEKFSSDFLTSEIDLMYKMQKDNPTEAIGKAKELIESCCETILEKSGIPLNKDWKLNNLVDETMKLLEITPKYIPDTVKEANAIKGLLGSLKGIASQIAIIRNAYGSGHGKSASYKGLQERHAKLAIGSSITLVNFLWDSFERKN
ncbi:abortive infection family protein [Prevotella sp. RM4]|uniref:abortive infection family protein n=1 Tax=Prevotella sp. RM4 TaxID=1200547 RepID=UPI000AAB426D|nr:abortive infection family protein [Prevotella sp. RM4]